MSPLQTFHSVWNRCAHLTVLHAYVAAKVTSVLRPDELLRAEWVARVSALDLYVHELVAQRMLDIFEGRLTPSRAYLKFVVSVEVVDRIRTAGNTVVASAAFDLEVRRQLAQLTYQDPDRIADGVRLFSDLELWNEVALKLGATQKTKVERAKTLKKELSLIVQRRNKIAHEGDLQPAHPRDPWPIQAGDLTVVKKRIEDIVNTIDTLA